MKNFDDWLNDYYPVDAYDFYSHDVIAMLDHGILKWSGFDPDILEEYGTMIYKGLVGKYISAKDHHRSLSIDCGSCALCVNFQDDDGCSKCPIVIETGDRCEGPDSPFMTFIEKNDGQPMVELLKQVRAKVIARLEKEKERDEV